MFITAFMITNSSAQVGINTETPKATLDVSSSPLNASKTDGIIPPQLTGNQLKSKDLLYTSALAGTIIYASSAANPVSTKTINVTAAGFYYFDGSVWQSMKGTGSPDLNIYKDDGTLTSTRNVTMNNKQLHFTNGSNGFIFNANGNLGILDAGGSTRGAFRATGGSAVVSMFVDNNNLGQVVSTGNSTGLLVGSTNGSIRFSTGGTNKAVVTSAGNLGINTESPSQRLDVDGNARFRSVPAGNLGDTDSYLGVTSNGTLKKFDVALPAFGLYATSNQLVDRLANGVHRPLNFESTNKVDNQYIVRIGAAGNTFRAVKRGIYTVEVWANFAVIPESGTGGNTGCTLQVGTPGNAVQLMGDRWASGGGTANVTRTMILNANDEIGVQTICNRNGAGTIYRTGRGSTIFITYLPLN